MLTGTCKDRYKRQREVLIDATRHFAVLVGYSDDRPPFEPYAIDGQTGTLSEEFLAEHAYDLGVQAAKNCEGAIIAQEPVPDDNVASIAVDWGTGATAALFSGGDVIFQEMTSYTAGPVVESWDDVDKLHFDPQNRLAQWEAEFWRGVSSAYVEGIAVTGHLFRSPLDLANDLRGNQLFMDMHIEPEQVERLVGVCTDMIIECDKFFRSEFPLLREAPGGIWGVGLPQPGMLTLNGDPVDLISLEMGERFNHPFVERLIDYAGSLYFHHHTLGVSRFDSVSRIRNLTVQQFTNDPKCPNPFDLIDDEWVAASNRATIDIWQSFSEEKDIDRLLEKMSGGRFILRGWAQTADEARQFVERIRAFDVQP